MTIGVIFDWDGVIIDSSTIHEASWERVAEETGYVLKPGDFKKSFGRKNVEVIPSLFGWTEDLSEIEELSELKEQRYRDIINAQGIETLPGVIDFLNSLREAQIPFGIGSSTARKNLDTIINKLGLQGYFKGITCAEDVTRGKPHPDVFLKAAEKIGVEPERCVVFEDSFSGIQAAHAAGMKTIGVATTYSADELKDKAHLIVHHLTELTPRDITELFKMVI